MKNPPEHSKTNEAALTSGLSAPATRALIAAGITTLGQLAQFTEKQILSLHGMGPKGIRQLKSNLASRGLSFRKTASH